MWSVIISLGSDDRYVRAVFSWIVALKAFTRNEVLLLIRGVVCRPRLQILTSPIQEANALIWSRDSREKRIRIKIIMAKIYTFKLIKLLLNNLKVLDYSTVCFDQSHIGKYWSSCQGKTLQKLSGREKTKFGFCKVRVIRSRVKLEQLCNENAEDIDCGSSSRDVRVSYGLNIWTLRVTGISFLLTTILLFQNVMKLISQF